MVRRGLINGHLLARLSMKMTRLASVTSIAALSAAGDSLAPPCDAQVKAVAERGLRAPARECRQTRRIGDQGAHFRLFGAKTRAFADPRFVGAGHILEQRHHIANPSFNAGSGVVDRAEFSILRRAKGKESPHGVAHEGKIPCRAEIAQTDFCAGWVEHLADRSWDNGAFALARPERVERPQHDGKHIVRPGKRLDHLVSAYFACGVRRLTMQRMVFADRLGEGGAIDLAGRGVDEAPHRPAAGRFQKIERAVDIDIDAGLRRHIGIRNADQGGEETGEEGEGEGAATPDDVLTLAIARGGESSDRRVADCLFNMALTCKSGG